MEYEEILNLSTKFEEIIKSALDQKYRGEKYPEENHPFKQYDPLFSFNLVEFCDLYKTSKKYSDERLERAILYLFDLKLEIYFLWEVDMGAYNTRVIDAGYDFENPLNTPHLLMTKYSTDQTVIVKSRILWERLMNFVYYIETGEELEDKVSRKKSKSRVFFEYIENKDKLKFLYKYKNTLESFESSFRTPEVHKNSIFRAELLGNRKIDILEQNQMLNLTRIVGFELWDNIKSMLKSS